MKVRLKENVDQFKFLTPGKDYVVLGLDHESFRLLDEKGEPILFPRSAFQLVDSEEPGDWIWERFSDDEFYADPADLHAPGFYEDLFDRKEDAVKKFQSYLKRLGVECRVDPQVSKN